MTKQLIIADRAIDVQYNYTGGYSDRGYLIPPERPELVIERFYEGNKDVSELIFRWANSDQIEAIEDHIKYW